MERRNAEVVVIEAADGWHLRMARTMYTRIGVILKIILVSSATILLSAAGEPIPFPPLGLLQFQGTPEEQAACDPDAKKFCSEAIPDTFRVLACLQRNRVRLRQVCAQVLEAHGQ
jgi:hypothetical protein